MKREEFEAQQRAIPDDKLVEMAQAALSKLCETGGRSLKMTVPPRIDDTDMIFSEVIRRFKDRTPLPPVEGAEEFLKQNHISGADFVYTTGFRNMVDLMTEFATLHAQKIADKMYPEEFLFWFHDNVQIESSEETFLVYNDIRFYTLNEARDFWQRVQEKKEYVKRKENEQ